MKTLKQTYGTYQIINRQGVYEIHNMKDTTEQVRCYSDKAFAIQQAQRLASKQASAAATAWIARKTG